MSNTITIKGNVGRDPELRFTQSGDAVITVSVADERSRKNDRGEWEKLNTTWWNCQLWGDAAQAVADQVGKGDRVVVTGRAELRTYETRDGGEGKSLDVRADSIAIIPKTASSPRHAPTGSPWGGAQADDPNEPPF